MSNPTILLFSGGIDSTALLDLYIKNKKEFRCIHFSYGQKNERMERIASKNIANHYNIEVENINISFPLFYNKDEILCRNAMLIISAAAINTDPCQIALGIHGGTDYYDCSKDFILNCQKILDGYFLGIKQIVTPFIEYNKDDIINYCFKHKIPLELTYSCIRSNSPCGICGSCLQRAKVDEAIRISK